MFHKSRTCDLTDLCYPAILLEENVYGNNTNYSDKVYFLCARKTMTCFDHVQFCYNGKTGKENILFYFKKILTAFVYFLCFFIHLFGGEQLRQQIINIPTSNTTFVISNELFTNQIEILSRSYIIVRIVIIISLRLASSYSL